MARIIVLVILFVSFSAQAQEQADSVVLFRGPQRAGVTDVEPVREMPTIQWRQTLSEHALSAVVLSDDQLFVGTHDGGQLWALNAATGDIEWTISDLDHHVTPVAVTDTQVLFGNTGGVFQAVDRFSGNPLWIYDAGQPLWSAPLVLDESVLLVDQAGLLTALNTQTGAEQWRLDPNQPSFGSPAYESGLVIVAGAGVSGIALEEQDIQWQNDDATQLNPVALADGVAYAGSDNGTFYALDTATGDILWTASGQPGRLAWSGPAADDSTVYAGNRFEGVHAYDAPSGDGRWFVPLADVTISDPLVAGDTVYVGTGNREPGPAGGGVYALDSASGEILWQIDLEARVYNSPAAGNGVVYVITMDGQVVALS